MLPAACLAAVVSALVGGLLFDELGPGQAALGLALQAVATVVVARWRAPAVPAGALVTVTAVLAYAPIGWQRAFESQVTVWVPVMAAYAAARLAGGARRRRDVFIGGVALVAWLVVMVTNGPPTRSGPWARRRRCWPGSASRSGYDCGTRDATG